MTREAWTPQDWQDHADQMREDARLDMALDRARQADLADGIPIASEVDDISDEPEVEHFDFNQAFNNLHRKLFSCRAFTELGLQNGAAKDLEYAGRDLRDVETLACQLRAELSKREANFLGL